MSEDVPKYQGIDNTFGVVHRTTELKSVYIPTTFIVPPELKVGDKWYVKQKDRNDLVVFKILEVTEKTVLVEDHNMGWQHIRYKKTDIEFVEKVQ